LAANTQKGVKPKELEVLGIDEFIKANPEATLSEVVAGVAPNKVQITKTVAGGEGRNIEFDVTQPDIDPTTGKSPVDEQILMEKERLQVRDDFTLEEFVRYVNGRTTTRLQPFKNIDELEDFYKQGNISPEEYNKLVEDYAKDVYRKNAYEMITVKGDPAITEQNIYAYGNDSEGYVIMNNAEDVTNKLDPPMSRTEAQIQLQNELDNMGFRNLQQGATQYKSYIDETLPGGSNYREVVFRYENAPEPHSVTTHFDDDQALASALIRDRKLDDGAETLHVDELQSDLHTKGSRDGYKLPETVKKQEIDKVNKFLEGSGQTMKPPESLKIDTLVDNVIFVNDGDEFLGSFPISQVKGLANELKQGRTANFGSSTGNALVKNLGAQKIYELEKLIQPLDETQRAVPNYPFKDDWYVMSLKQLIKDAIDEGKDAISVSGSAPIKARYTDQYSKFYESLYDQKIPSAMKKLANKYGGKFEKGSLDYDDTFDVLVGDNRDIRALENFVNRYDNFDENLPIDEILEKTLVPNLESNIIRITPEMRAKIAEEGLPSFAFGGAVETPMRLTMPEDVNIFADAQFTQPKTLTEKIASGMTDLAFGRITKDDFFRDNVVRNVLAELDLPAIVQNNLLRSEDAQNFALNTLQQAIGSPVDVTALGDDRFALDYSQKLGPGILSLAGELGSDEPSARVSYDSKDFMISPSTTARFAASLDKDRGKDFSAEVTYQPDPKTFVEGQAIFGEGVSPEYRLNFGRRF
jgi:hypothetical protein